MDINKLELVIFDMDGLMLDTERFYYNSVKEMCEKGKINVNMDAYRSVIGTSKSIDMNDFNRSCYSNKELDIMIRKQVESVRENFCLNGAPIKKGLLQLLHTLNKKGIRKAVATSTPFLITERLLKSVELESEFEFIVTSEEVKKGKPYPDIFWLACKKAGVSYENSLVLEDSIPGALAALTAGIPYIIVPDINYPTKGIVQAAVMVAESLSDVNSIFCF